MRDLSQYDNLRNLIKTGDLVEWCGKGFVSYAIRCVTRKGVSHSSLVVRIPYGDQTRGTSSRRCGQGLSSGFLSDSLQKYDGARYGTACVQSTTTNVTA